MAPSSLNNPLTYAIRETASFTTPLLLRVNRRTAEYVDTRLLSWLTVFAVCYFAGWTLAYAGLGRLRGTCPRCGVCYEVLRTGKGSILARRGVAGHGASDPQYEMRPLKRWKGPMNGRAWHFAVSGSDESHPQAHGHPHTLLVPDRTGGW